MGLWVTFNNQTLTRPYLKNKARKGAWLNLKALNSNPTTNKNPKSY
jgi:hypothetical protein